jgi:hypothetical protein
MGGEMLDETMTAPATLSPAVTFAYRHYGVTTETAPEFNSLIALAPRASVDEGSAAVTLATPGSRVGMNLRGGLGFDSAREARQWRAGGTLVWAPMPATRFTLGYDESSEIAIGLLGRSRRGWMSIHVDL